MIFLAALLSLVALPQSPEKPVPSRFAGPTAPVVRAVASKSQVLIAEPFSIRIEVIANAGDSIEFPSFEDRKIVDFDVVSIQTTRDLPMENADSDRRLWTQTISLETLKLGEQTLPPMNVTIVRGDVRQSVATQRVVVTVEGVSEDINAPLRPIADRIELPDGAGGNGGRWRPGRWVGAVFVSLMGLAAYRWWRRRNRTWRWCHVQLLALETELQAITGNAAPPKWPAWAKRLREVLRVAVSAHRGELMKSLSTRQFLDVLGQLEPDVDLSQCERLFKQLDQHRFGSRKPPVRPSVPSTDADIESSDSSQIISPGGLAAALEQTKRFVDQLKLRSRGIAQRSGTDRRSV